MTARRTEIHQWKYCPVCGAVDRQSHVEFDELEFVRCNGCTAVYKSREIIELRPDGYYEEEYFLGRKSKRHKRFEHRVNKAMRQIREGLEFTKAQDLLDVGCALGYVLEGGKRLGLKSSGLDVSKFAAEFCTELGFDAKEGSLESLPWDNQSFDLVVMKHVLEHTPDPKKALTEVHRVLRPGGSVVATVPNLRYWKGILLKRRYRYFRPDDLGMQHYVYYTPNTLALVFKKSGFQVLRRSKVTFRNTKAKRGFISAVFETLRFVGLGLWQGLATALFQRRELLIVARRAPTDEQ
jgi:SAM-dependent methyltransferase